MREAITAASAAPASASSSTDVKVRISVSCPGCNCAATRPGEVLVAVDDGGQLAGPLPVGELLNVEGVVDADAADADGGDFEGSGHPAAQRKYLP